jgi:hypothetical protein
VRLPSGAKKWGHSQQRPGLFKALPGTDCAGRWPYRPTSLLVGRLLYLHGKEKVYGSIP